MIEELLDAWGAIVGWPNTLLTISAIWSLLLVAHGIRSRVRLTAARKDVDWWKTEAEEHQKLASDATLLAQATKVAWQLQYARRCVENKSIGGAVDYQIIDLICGLNSRLTVICHQLRPDKSVSELYTELTNSG